jgi:hypothetical protein
MMNVIIVEKLGMLKQTSIKKYNVEELYKKCGFKKSEGFEKQTEWGVKMDKKKYIIAVFAKTTGKANSENKYDFPPPIDTKLFFGNCLIVRYEKEANGTQTPCSLSLEQWQKVYEDLFGGFEDLSSTALDDEKEVDELANIANKYKTSSGYLKDGFVVDDSDKDGDSKNDKDESSEFSDNTLELNMEDEDEDEHEDEDEDEVEMSGSELSEDEYVTESETEVENADL